jgi:hypothetical protein
MYNETRKLYDRIASQDQCITFLLIEVRALQRRVDHLEKARARAATEDASRIPALSGLDQSTHP